MIVGGWPFRLSLQKDELLSSYLVRSAHVHGSTPHIFCNLFWPKKPIWTRDIDRDPNPTFLADISKITGVSIGDLEASSLRDFRKQLSGGHLLKHGDTPLLLSASVYHRTRRFHALQFCPQCLANGVPYFRKVWRLGFVVFCNEHGVVMLDSCPHCDSPVVPHRTQPLKSADCHRCRLPLCATSYVPPEIPKVVISLQRSLLSALFQNEEMGTIDGKIIPSVFVIARALLAVSTSRFVQAKLRRFFGIGRLHTTKTNLQVEHERIPERVEMLETVAHWLSDWPQSFLNGAASARITQTTFSRHTLPNELSEQVAKLPIGIKHVHSYIPVLNTPELLHLRRKDPSTYRRVRAQQLVKAAVNI